MKILLTAVSAFALSGCIIVDAAPSSFAPTANAVTKLAPFDRVELRGGGEIMIRFSSDYTFENTSDNSYWAVGIDDDALVLSCYKSCVGSNSRSGIVTMPRIEGLKIKGGADIDFEGAFEKRDEFKIELLGGGDVNAFAVPADKVDVSIKGGGDIKVSPSSELNVSIFGGGDVQYRGTPEVSKSIFGGGEVRSVD